MIKFRYLPTTPITPITLITLITLSTLLTILTPPSYAHAHKKETKGLQSLTLNDSFQDGWKVGWKAGWRQVNGQYSFPSFPPFPPFPNFGEDNFQGGYNAGFLAGIAAAGG